MSENYTRGIAFIMEGTTEKVFYRTYLQWLAEKNNCTFEKLKVSDSGDIPFVWKNANEKILIKFNIVGTVTQVVHSGRWFANACAKKYKIPWNVYLCYDTDSPENDISKFYQDDWKLLRESIQEAKATRIIDLAARADIEDVMLVDCLGVCNFLQISVPEKLAGRQGKAKMKALYRGVGRTYHEGDRASGMIESLDFQKIMEEGPIAMKYLKDDLV